MLQQIQHKLKFKRNASANKTPKGQSLVEMAIITPLLIFFLLGIFEVGSAIRGYVVLVNTNREITRYAVRPGYMDFSTTDSTQASFEDVKNWSYGALGEQLVLDLDDTSGDATIIVSHVVVDTGLPCEDIYDKPGDCDCDAFESNPAYGYPEDDLILHPDMDGQWFQRASFGPEETVTGSRKTRLVMDDIVPELKAKNNKFNCEVIKKGGTPSNNNVIITEIFYDQPQLFGFPFISNPFTDPVPLYTHTSMRLINGARNYTFENTGPYCMAYPITFSETIFDDAKNPKKGQTIDAFEGDSPGNFGWITWNPASGNNNANYVEKELKNPRLSINDFIDALDNTDTSLSIDDDVSTKPGVANSNGVDEQLQLLVGQEIIIPVYDNNPGTGAGSYYHVSHFAKIRVDQICLPRNGSKCDGENSKQIKATFLGYADDVCAASNPPPGGGSNTPPDATDDTASTTKNTTVVINVLGNDTDPDGDTLAIDSVTETSSPFQGTLQVTDGATTITYAPKNNDTGTYTFSYTINDGNGGTDTATVTITVVDGSVNNPPIAANNSATTNQNTAVTIDVDNNDSDPDGDPITVDSVTSPSNGTTINNGDGTITYTPNSGFTGSDSFTYTISDDSGETDTATVTVTVNAPNSPPVAGNDTSSTNENQAVTINIGTNDSDPDGDALIFTVGIASHGTVVYNGSGQVTYTPDAGYSGPDSFTYMVGDGNGGSDSATVSIMVNASASNDPPIANDDGATTGKNTGITINVLSNDTDPNNDTLTITSLGTPTQGGSVVNNGDGTVTFNPKNGFKNGDDTFTYSISDGNGGTDTATITVTVTD